MPNTIISVKIGAEAGQGVKSAGLMLAKLAIRSGYHIYNHIEYPSLIKGGHNVLQVNISKEEVTAPRKVNDILIALNQDTINKHVTEFAGEAGLIYDSEAKIDTSKVPSTVALIGVPLSKIAKEAGNSDLLINTVALGAVTAVLGGNLIILNGLISEEFGSKGDEVVKVNVTAAENGFKFVTENYKQHLKNSLSPLESLSNFVPYMAIDGNESVALGAISAGLQYAAIYPMRGRTFCNKYGNRSILRRGKSYDIHFRRRFLPDDRGLRARGDDRNTVGNYRGNASRSCNLLTDLERPGRPSNDTKRPSG
ncbi:MAG: Pyruvate flavodoxin/ferredoxin oxidoreductase domain protein [candidate division WWE3 bacterium GW2011_GWC1_42_102]|nr:MAG: Pyruvate flavodoxin/ferredoxin oxidoreductase domain protein [candidate division WWE3 bacterium GW2011_GWC1_42_102]